MKLFNSLINKIKIMSEEGFFHILIGGTLTKIVVFGSSILVARWVDKNEYAYLVTADTMFAYILNLHGLGMPSALLLNCTPGDENNKNSAYFRFALTKGSFVQLLLSLLLIVYVSIVELPFPNTKRYVYLLVLYPFLSNLVETFQSYYRANLLNKEFARTSLFQTVILLLGNIVLLKHFNVVGNIVARYISVIVTIIILVYLYFQQDQTNTIGRKLSKEDKSLFLKQSISFVIANYFSAIMAQNEISLVNNLITDTVVTANYKIASLIPSQITFLTSSIMVFYFPKIAQLKKIEKIKKETRNVALLTAFVIFSTALAGFFLSPYIVRIFYGNKFDDAIKLSAFFWIVHSINAGFRMVPMNILPAINEYKYNAYISVGTSLFHFIIESLLIKKFGVYGAAFGSLLVYFLSGVVLWLALLQSIKRKKLLEIN